MNGDKKSLAYRLSEAQRMASEMFAIVQNVKDRPVMLAALDLLRGKIRARVLTEDAEQERQKLT